MWPITSAKTYMLSHVIGLGRETAPGFLYPLLGTTYGAEGLIVLTIQSFVEEIVFATERRIVAPTEWLKQRI